MPPRKHDAERQRILDVLGAVPKGIFCELAGRSAHSVNEQAVRHGMPTGSGVPSVDMGAFVRWVYDDIARRAVEAKRTTSAPERDAKERKLLAQAEKEELLVAKMRGDLVPREEVLQAVQDYAGLVGAAIERVRQARTEEDTWARELNEALEEGLESFVGAVEEGRGGDGEGEGDEDGEAPGSVPVVRGEESGGE